MNFEFQNHAFLAIIFPNLILVQILRVAWKLSFHKGATEG